MRTMNFSALSRQLAAVHQRSHSAADAVHPERRRRLSGQLLLLVLHYDHRCERLLLLPITRLRRHRMSVVRDSLF